MQEIKVAPLGVELGCKRRVWGAGPCGRGQGAAVRSGSTLDVGFSTRSRANAKRSTKEREEMHRLELWSRSGGQKVAPLRGAERSGCYRSGQNQNQNLCWAPRVASQRVRKACWEEGTRKWLIQRQPTASRKRTVWRLVGFTLTSATSDLSDLFLCIFPLQALSFRQKDVNTRQTTRGSVFAP